jgi:hypothetical protein
VSRARIHHCPIALPSLCSDGSVLIDEEKASGKRLYFGEWILSEGLSLTYLYFFLNPSPAQASRPSGILVKLETDAEATSVFPCPGPPLSIHRDLHFLLDGSRRKASLGSGVVRDHPLCILRQDVQRFDNFPHFERISFLVYQ